MCGEGYGKAADAESGEDRCDLLSANDLGNLNNSKDDNCDAQAVADDRGEHIIQLTFCFSRTVGQPLSRYLRDKVSNAAYGYGK